MSTTAPVEVERPAGDEVAEPDVPWIVIVWNDPVNLMSYVVYVFQKLFGYSREKATRLMLDVHHKGKAVVSNGARETGGVGGVRRRAARPPPRRPPPVGLRGPRRGVAGVVGEGGDRHPQALVAGPPEAHVPVLARGGGGRAQTTEHRNGGGRGGG